MVEEQIAPELVQRMAAHFRELEEEHRSSRPVEGSHFAKQLAEIRAIVAELPKPVDPDLIEAREIASANNGHAFASYRQGENDDFPYVRIALAAIKRGRELAQAGPRP